MLLVILDKLVDIVHRPIELVSDWASEPLKSNEMKRKIAEARDKGMAEAEIEKMMLAFKHELRIKQKTEIAQIYMELEQIKLDKEFERQKEISEAIMGFQRQLTRMNIDAVNAIGEMQLDLRGKAQALMQEKTREYRALQTEAHQQARQELKELDEDFPDYQRHKPQREMLMGSINSRLVNVIAAAEQFLNALNEDIRAINGSITVLTERGQEAILEQIEHFRLNAAGALPAPPRSDVSEGESSSVPTVTRISQDLRA